MGTARLQDLFIGIAGLIGAGKTTLATTLLIGFVLAYCFVWESLYFPTDPIFGNPIRLL